MCAHRLPTTAPTPLRKLHSLRAADAQAAFAAVQAATPDWAVDQHEDSDGDLMLMLTPPGPEDTTPTFVLSGTAAGIVLAVALGDSCDTLGAFDGITAAINHGQEIMTLVA